MKYEQIDNEFAQKVMHIFHRASQQFKTKEDLSKFAGLMASISIGLMRGIEGDKFTSEFLEGAIKNEQNFVIKPEFIN